MSTVSTDLDLHKFKSIIEEYSSMYQNPPNTAYQLSQFCKDKAYNYKYGELNPYFHFWQKQQKQVSTTSGTDATVSEEHDTPKDLNWDSFWNQYEQKYNYPPKKAVHLWNFAKEEKMVVVKYKEARIAFDRIFSEYKKTQNDSNIEGYRTRSDTDLGLKCSQNKDILRLRINKYTTSDDIERIRVSFLECLESYRKQILHDPVSPLHLFNFINEDMAYSVRYADVKSAYRFAVKHQWFKPKKRMKKVHKRAREVEGSDETETQGEYVLEEVIKEAKETKKEAVIVIQDAMDDAVFDTLLVKYQMEYQNPPRNASQIMNFAKECGELFKYKACRIAFHRWQHARGSRMPQMELEPGNNGNDRE
eukprot:208514_1